MENYIVAIDLGTTKIVTLIGEKTESGRYRILKSYELQSTGIVRGEVENLKDVTELIKKSVDELRKESEFEISEVYVGIAGQHIRCMCESVKELRNNEKAQITQDEIDALQQKMYSVRMEPGEEILHVIPQSFNVDDKMDIRKPVGMLGKELTGNYHIVLGRTNAIDVIKECLNNEEVKLNLNRLILEPLASAAAVLNDEEKELGVALVDIGGGTTDLVVYYDNIIRHSAVIPFGGNIVTKDIKDGCKISQETAEKIKINYGTCLGHLSSENIYISISGKNIEDKKEISTRILSKIIDARMEEILSAIMYELELSGFLNKINAGIVFTGGGSLLTNFKQFAELKTGLKARIGKPVYLSSDTGKHFAQPFYSTAIGLVIKGVEYEKLKKTKEQIPASKQEEIVIKQKNIKAKTKKQSKIKEFIEEISNMFTNNDTV